jgi:hypothetical protein
MSDWLKPYAFIGTSVTKGLDQHQSRGTAALH